MFGAGKQKDAEWTEATLRLSIIGIYLFSQRRDHHRLDGVYPIFGFVKDFGVFAASVYIHIGVTMGLKAVAGYLSICVFKTLFPSPGCLY